MRRSPAAAAVRRGMTGLARAIGARPTVFLLGAAGVFALNLFLPVLVLSLARRPVDFYTFNPWLSRLPAYLASEEVPLRRKLEFLPNLVLFWFSADGVMGPDWGLAVDVRDLVRFGVTALLFGAYFALWAGRRAQGTATRAGRHGGAAGALACALGASSGPCSVIGCGAPGLPVLGLALAGLSTDALHLLVGVARVTTGVVLAAMTVAVAWLAWRAGCCDDFSTAPRERHG